MTYKFITPSVEEGPAGQGRLFARYRINRGVSVYGYNGGYAETRFPTEDLIRAHSPFYIGGRTYEVDAAEAARLQAAGYTVVSS
jgi:hypothetical protein